MDKKKEEFLARLRETFRIEAEEHLEVVTTGLMELEGGTAVERASVIEKVYREIHSLKGAARSVNYRNIEALCQDLESIFSAIKHGDIEASAPVLDLIRPAFGALKTMCEGALSPQSPESLKEEEAARASLGHILSHGNGKGREAPCVAPQSPAPHPIVAASAASETVRVSTQKLGAVLLETEELMGAKIAARGRATEIRGMARSLAEWNRRPALKAARRGRDHPKERSVYDLLESETLHAKALEYSLRKLAAAANQDSLSLASTADRLLENTKDLLLLPCSHLLKGLHLVLRDLSRDQGKEADLTLRGEDIEIDRRVLDELKDPLVHLLRNCVDHGFEKPEERIKAGKPRRGTVTVAVKAIEGNRIEFSLSDDGSGIDVAMVRQVAARLGLIETDGAPALGEAEAEALEFIFASGLSTSPIITDLSGRGLGLAIVRERIEKLGGAISVTTKLGQGTSFRLIVPLSLATFRGVMVDVAGRSFVIPTINVMRAIRVGPDDIGTVEGRRAISWEGRALSFASLRDVLGLEGPGEGRSDELRPALVLRAGERHVAFLVDAVLGEEEVMVKSLGPQLPRVRNIAGAVISDGGTVIPILDVADLVESSSSASRAIPTMVERGEDGERQPRILVAEDSITARTLVKNILEGAGYEVMAAVDGVDALTRLKSEPFDLLVSDVDMPRMNGFELTAAIRADIRLSELPVVLVTALGSPKDREYGIEVGANAYIVKSDFDQGNLLEILRSLL